MGLKNTNRINREDIYAQHSSSDLFNYYFGSFSFGRCYPSVFRKDDNPSTGFYVNRAGYTIYNDITTGEKLDVFAFVAKKHNLSYSEAVKQVYDEFKIGLIDSTNFKPIVHVPQTKKDTTIEIVYKKWDQDGLDYWKQYSITEKELTENEVYNVKKLIINGQERPNYLNELRFAYILEYKDKFYKKIYQPYSSKEFKWKTNCPIYLPFGYNKLSYMTDTLIVCKSVKEMIIFKKFFPDVIAVQNESPASLREVTIKKLKEKYKKIYIFFDIDEPGLKAVTHYEELGLTPIYLPTSALKNNVKDSADFVGFYGLRKFEEFLKYKKLI